MKAGRIPAESVEPELAHNVRFSDEVRARMCSTTATTATTGSVKRHE